MVLPVEKKAAAPNAPSFGGKPQVDAFSIKGKMTGSKKDITSVLSSVSFLEVATEKDAINAVYVESRDINKEPYLFSIIRIREDVMEVVYSIPQEIAPRKRKVDMIRYLLNILTLINDFYQVDIKVIYQLMETAVKDISESVTMEYSKLYTAYDSLKKENQDLKKKVTRLSEENTALTSKTYELKAKSDEVEVELSKYRTLSDEVLRAKLQEWILEHAGEINVIEFAKIHHVTESQVEMQLNKLVNEGYLAVLS